MRCKFERRDPQVNLPPPPRPPPLPLEFVGVVGRAIHAALVAVGQQHQGADAVVRRGLGVKAGRVPGLPGA